MKHLFSVKSRSLWLRPLILACLLSQIVLSVTVITGNTTSTARAMAMDAIKVKYLNLFLPNGTQGYKVMSDGQPWSNCVKDGITTQKWDKTMFTIYPDPLAGGSRVTVRAFTTSDCSDNPASQTFHLPYIPTTDTCRLNLLSTRVNGCTDTIIVSVNTVVVWPPANGTAVKFIYSTKPKGVCQNTQPLSWGSSNTFNTHTSLIAGSKIEFTAYTGTCSQLGTQLVDLSFTLPDAGTARDSECWINLEQQPNGSISGCTNGY